MTTLETGRPARSGLRAAAAALSLAALAACSLDLTNPNALSEEDVLETPNGIIALAVGMQSQYANSVADWVRAPALVTDEWGTNTGSLLAYQTLLTGQQLEASFAVVNDPWASAFRVVRSADALLDNVGGVGLDAGTTTGIRALARTYKAMALGQAIMQYERIPVDGRSEAPTPQPRGVVLDSIAVLLEAARAELGTSPDLTIFNARVAVPGINLPNLINAMLARYYLMDGEYAKAIEAAQRVNLGSVSRFPYTGTSVNPIWNISGNSFYILPLASFRAAAEPGDARVAYWVDPAAAATRGNPDSLLVPLAQYRNRNDPFPAYLPDEVRLVQAEALARSGNLGAARDLINAVRTQCLGTGALEPSACLPALPAEELDTLAEVLAQIAYERRYELYMQGLRWEDLRRLGEENAVGAPPVVDYLPVPLLECRNNPNAGCVA